MPLVRHGFSPEKQLQKITNWWTISLNLIFFFFKSHTPFDHDQSHDFFSDTSPKNISKTYIFENGFFFFFMKFFCLDTCTNIRRGIGHQSDAREHRSERASIDRWPPAPEFEHTAECVYNIYLCAARVNSIGTWISRAAGRSKLLMAVSVGFTRDGWREGGGIMHWPVHQTCRTVPDQQTFARKRRISLVTGENRRGIRTLAQVDFGTCFICFELRLLSWKPWNMPHRRKNRFWSFFLFCSEQILY